MDGGAEAQCTSFSACGAEHARDVDAWADSAVVSMSALVLSASATGHPTGAGHSLPIVSAEWTVCGASTLPEHAGRYADNASAYRPDNELPEAAYISNLAYHSCVIPWTQLRVPSDGSGIVFVDGPTGHAQAIHG